VRGVAVTDNPLPEETYRFVVGPGETGRRLDIILTERISAVTRSMIGNLIRSGHVRVDAAHRKTGFRVRAGEEVVVSLPPPLAPDIRPDDSVFFKVLFEDDDFVVLSKPPGVVVHPACGHRSSTLVHGLLAHCGSLSGSGGEWRPGIVHRLDKDTSGIMLVAKNDRIHQAFSTLFKQRGVEKVYHALVDGSPQENKGRITLPIGRHPVNRKKMAVLPQGGRNAATCWRVLQRFSDAISYLEVRPETGRTHQIRVHLSHLGLPIIGDAMYGRKQGGRKGLAVQRQCLHASSLSFVHPETGEALCFNAPLWPDMQEILCRLGGRQATD